MNRSKTGGVILSTLLLSLLSACGQETPEANTSAAATQATTVEQRVRVLVADHLRKPLKEIDVTVFLLNQGADELDLVEIVMAAEERFKVEVSDDTIGDTKSMTVQSLAATFVKQGAK